MIYLYWKTESTTLLGILTCTRVRIQETLTFTTTNQLPTTTKPVINAVLDSNSANDHCESRKIFLEDRYDCTDIFAVLFEEMNLIGGGTYRNNIIGFTVNNQRLKPPKGSERGTYRHLYNMRFNIVSIIWKVSRTLHIIRSLINTRITEVSSRRGRDIHQVVCSEYLTEYHYNMDGVDQGEQLWEHSDGLSSKSHFKSCTNVVTYVCVMLVY